MKILNKHNKLVYIKNIDGLDIYEYKPRLFKYFYTPLAYYESLTSRKIRETLDYIRGNYKVIYISKEEKLVGYCTLVRGGGRYTFSSRKDSVICNVWINESERGKGYSKILVEYATKLNKRVYAFVRHNNIASINCFTRIGYRKIANVEYTHLHILHCATKGHLGLYLYERPNNLQYDD